MGLLDQLPSLSKSPERRSQPRVLRLARADPRAAGGGYGQTRSLSSWMGDSRKQSETLGTKQFYLATEPFCNSVPESPVPKGTRKEQRRTTKKEWKKGGRASSCCALAKHKISGGSSEAEL